MSVVLSSFNPDARIILTLCSNDDELYASQIAKKSEMPNVTVFDRLAKLEKEGLVQSERKGKMKFYKLTDIGNKRVESLITSMQNLVNSCYPTKPLRSGGGSKFIKPKKEKISALLLNNLQRNLKNSKVNDVMEILPELWKINMVINNLFRDWNNSYEFYPKAFMGTPY